jgi:hypothetical protein
MRQRIWVGGRLGTAYRFDGSSWRRERIPLTFSSEFTWSIGATSDGLRDFATVSALRLQTGQTQQYFFIRNDSVWNLVDSFYVGYDIFSPKFGAKYWFLPSGELYSIGYGFFRWTDETWQLFYLDNETATDMWGTRKEHLFLTVNNHLIHYNGQDFFRFEPIGDPTWTYYSVWCNENEVFVVTNDGLQTYILHGE